ncbi:MAG: FAD-dependent oxidoreductase [Nitrososphaerota archaeon]|jgi:hypothetical protein|nr:FAD-dependent oxidoreductase [Nitrososphaerota archaeon]MDG7037941.1 FAD-dependent oxidoreductase [Nitrososphaerota archaeon]
MITLENMCIIYRDARSGATQPRIDSDDFIPGLSRISNGIHLFGSYASMELTHPGIFSETEVSGRHPVGPSPLDLRNDGMIPRELDEKGIGEIVEGFAGAASRAKAAGYDGVEIEAAHGLLEYYDHMLRKLGIEIKFNREARPDDIRGSGFDAVIVAAGSRCYVPTTDRRNDIISAKKVLERRLEFKGSRIVVGGGGLVGCETALYLTAQGNDVTIVEMMPQLALDMESLSRGHLLKELKRYNVTMITRKGIKQIHERHITLEGGDEIPMDYLIVAFGEYSDRSLYGELKEDYETYLVGDASKAGKIVDAVSSGYFTGRMI